MPRLKKMNKYLLIDIGGTYIKTATYEDSLSEVKEIATEATKGTEHLIETVKKLVEENLDVQAIGICTAGQVDAEEGKVTYANDNMPDYTGTCWKEILKEYNVPVFVENDVNSAAIGEGAYGEAQGLKDYICLTYGTGIGGAIILNGELYRGNNGSAGEFGALLMHATNHEEGRPFTGSYEEVASTRALVENAKKVDPTINSGREVFEKIDNHEIFEVVESWLYEVTLGLVSLIHILNPAMVILGGGIMERNSIFEAVKARVYEELMETYRGVIISKASLGNKAGMYGCLAIIKNEIKD